MLSLDGPSPFSFGFQPIEQLRRDPEIHGYFKETVGLVTQGEEWYTFRQAVQQDLMRPKSALYYIEEIEDVCQELVDKIEKARDGDWQLDSERIMQEYALEAVNVIFLGKKLGVLTGNPEGQAMINSTQIILKEILNMYQMPMTIGKYMPWYKRCLLYTSPRPRDS